MEKNFKIKKDFFEDCPVTFDDTEYNANRGINGKFGMVKYHDSTLGVLIHIEEDQWVYYFANNIQAGIIG